MRTAYVMRKYDAQQLKVLRGHNNRTYQQYA